MGEKVTKMELKVDLTCPKCYKKVKKVLCKFPETQDHVYDEKQNKVTIKVVSRNPEKIRDKILCKGRCSIKCIEIVPEKPTKPPATPTPAPAPTTPKPTPPVPPPCCPPVQTPCCPLVNPVPRPCCPLVPNPVPTPCCKVCCRGQGGGPCFQPCCKQGRSCGGCSRRRVYCQSRCTEYFCEENPSGCKMM